MLADQRFLLGDKLTEVDIRLFPTLIRFDSVYVSHFKCALRRIVDYPNLWAYTRDIFQLPGISETVDIDYNKAHYYGSHDTVNPHLIIPIGPEVDFSLHQDRARLPAAHRRSDDDLAGILLPAPIQFALLPDSSEPTEAAECRVDQFSW